MRRRVLPWLLCALACGASWGEDRVADAVLEALQKERVASGAQRLERRADLDAVARQRAQRVAALPHDARMDYAEPISDELRSAGVRLYRGVSAHLDMVRGYKRPEEGILHSWRTHDDNWTKALGAGYHAIGAASQRAEDGWVVFVAVLVENQPKPEDLRALETMLLDAVNSRRRERGVSELRAENRLAEVARSHSQDMARRGYLSHINPDGLDARARVERAGLALVEVGENILMSRGQQDPANHALEKWLSSEAHRTTLLDPRFVETGVGVELAEDGSLYFTQIFLRPPSPTAPAAVDPVSSTVR